MNNKITKKMITLTLSTALALGCMGTVSAYSGDSDVHSQRGKTDYIESHGNQDYLRPFMSGHSTTPALPYNENGNQGIVVLQRIIAPRDAGKTVMIEVSNFTNGMKSVNLSAHVDNEFLENAMEMYHGDEVHVHIPSDAAGKTLKITMSTNSVSGRCDLTLF